MASPRFIELLYRRGTRFMMKFIKVIETLHVKGNTSTSRFALVQDVDVMR